MGDFQMHDKRMPQQQVEPLQEEQLDSLRVAVEAQRDHHPHATDSQRLPEGLAAQQTWHFRAMRLQNHAQSPAFANPKPQIASLPAAVVLVVSVVH